MDKKENIVTPQQGLFTPALKKKTKIEGYPLSWSFKVIGLDKTDMVRDIELIMAQREYSLEESNKKGKYLSLNLTLTVASDAERTSVFNTLKNTDSVTMVL
jgi:putative lipoic acid-binding regulatory protein